jgi:hypothetical protein
MSITYTITINSQQIGVSSLACAAVKTDVQPSLNSGWAVATCSSPTVGAGTYLIVQSGAASDFLLVSAISSLAPPSAASTAVTVPDYPSKFNSLAVQDLLVGISMMFALLLGIAAGRR